VGIIDYFAAGMSSVNLTGSFLSSLFKLLGADALIVLVFRLILGILAAAICWKLSGLVSGVAFICVMIGIPFFDAFLGVALAGLAASWFEYEEAGVRASRG